LSETVSGHELTRATILNRAWPVMLANAAVPLLGLSDTAVIGNVGTPSDLGAIAFGAIIFSFVYWSFGFLRMGTTGFVAQAKGAKDELEIRSAVLRAVFTGLAIGCCLMLLKVPIADFSLSLLNGSDSVESVTRSYIDWRLLGAPAALALFALMGTMIGLGHTKALLAVQIFMNGSNILLDIYFAGVLEMGASGIALGTAIAEWTSLLLALFLVVRILKQRTQAELIPWQRLKDMASLRKTFSVNRDIMIRTFLLVSSFAWFVRESAQFGDNQLAANHILLQFISFSAFFLDAFAYIAEALVGEALGSQDMTGFDRAVRLSSELAIGFSLALAVGFSLFGEMLAGLLTQHDSITLVVGDNLTWASVYIFLSFAAFQFDGIFIGTTETAAMAKAAVISSGGYLLLSVVLTRYWGSDGLWLSFVALVVLRALALAWYYPALRRRIDQAS
tara:strand:- start:1882 stop:3222 length:1341 start_codon:yes stop_codon:yes gene_type:complete